MSLYFCHHLSNNYAALSDLYLILLDLNVDLSLIQILKTCSCPINAIQITAKLSYKSTFYLTSRLHHLTSLHNS